MCWPIWPQTTLLVALSPVCLPLPLPLPPLQPSLPTGVTPLTVTINQPKETRSSNSSSSSTNSGDVSRKSVINLLFSINYPLWQLWHGLLGLSIGRGTPKTLLNKFRGRYSRKSGGKKLQPSLARQATCKYFSLAEMPKCSLAQATRDDELWDPRAIRENDPN